MCIRDSFRHYDRLRTFGATAYFFVRQDAPERQKAAGKLYDRSRRRIFVGMAGDSRSTTYLCLNPADNSVAERGDVDIVEEITPAGLLEPFDNSTIPATGGDIDFDLDDDVAIRPDTALYNLIEKPNILDIGSWRSPYGVKQALVRVTTGAECEKVPPGTYWIRLSDLLSAERNKNFPEEHLRRTLWPHFMRWLKGQNFAGANTSGGALFHKTRVRVRGANRAVKKLECIIVSIDYGRAQSDFFQVVLPDGDSMWVHVNDLIQPPPGLPNRVAVLAKDSRARILNTERGQDLIKLLNDPRAGYGRHIVYTAHPTKPHKHRWHNANKLVEVEPGEARMFVKFLVAHGLSL